MRRATTAALYGRLMVSCRPAWSFVSPSLAFLFCTLEALAPGGESEAATIERPMPGSFAAPGDFSGTLALLAQAWNMSGPILDPKDAEDVGRD